MKTCMFCCYNSMTVLKAAHFTALYFMFTVNLGINNLKLPGTTKVCGMFWMSVHAFLTVTVCQESTQCTARCVLELEYVARHY